VSARVTGWAWEQDLLPQRKLLLLWLANRATDLGVCFPSKHELASHAGLGERMTRYHLAWLASDQDEQGRPKAPVLDIIERPIDGQRSTSNVYVLRVPWAEPAAVRGELAELKHVPASALRGVGAVECTQGGGCNGVHPVGAMGCTQVGAAGCMEKESPRKRHREHSPQPPTRPAQEQPQREQQQQGETVETTETVCPSPVPPGDRDEGVARALAAALYRGLGADLEQLTPALRRRELAIARQLVAVGATAREAEAYAREAGAQAGRYAAVDLRSYERERLGWQARRQGAQASLARRIDRTGEPPAGVSGSVQAGALVRGLFGGKP